MGSWDTGPFDNDDAADFMADLVELTNPAAVAATLGDALRTVTAAEGYLDSPDVSQAVAAAAVIGLASGLAAPVPVQIEGAWWERIGLTPSAELREQAAAALARALRAEDNEWHELWTESELLDEVSDKLAPYRVDDRRP